MNGALGLLARLLLFVGCTLVVTLGSGVVLRLVFPDAWRARWRRVWRIAFGVTAGALSVWILGRYFHSAFLMRTGAPIAAVLMMAIAGVFGSSPLWGLLGVAATRSRAAHDPKRRLFLTRAVGVVPGTAALAGPIGAVASTSTPLLRDVEIKSARIPRELDGLTILQISDVHLGAFVDLPQVQAVVDAVKARAAPPDLIALTGDIADDYTLLPPALELIRSIPAPLGMFAIIGNHEIYRGREAAIEHFENGGATFLCGDGVLIERKNAAGDVVGKLWLCGTDDASKVSGKREKFYINTVRQALKRCPDDVTCKIVLAHRPETFDTAADPGFAIALQLSGHTHGGQMALFGRSLLEGIVPEKYLLGHYEQNGARLFTTAGLGHWFPFRLNCPTEACVITLRSA